MVLTNDDFEDLAELQSVLQVQINDDYSHHEFINDIWNVKPAQDIILEVSLLLPVVLLGLFGNFLLIYTLLTNQHLRSPTNLMIGNMAMADMLSLLIHPWVYLTYDIFQNYILGAFGCQTEAALECAILISSVISLSVISYERLTLIVIPSSALNLTKTKVCMVLTWITGLILSTPLVIYRNYKERQWSNFLESFCVEQTIIIKIYYPIIITVLVLVPLSILIVCYITIFVKLRHFETVVLKESLVQHRKANYRKKVARMMFIVIITFTVCRLPFTSVIFYRYYRYTGKSPQTINDFQTHSWYFVLWFSSKYLMFVNAAINPIIYGITNEKFRRAFKNTKFSKWLFKKQEVIPDAPKHYQPSTENIFLIFKNKLKLKREVTPTKKYNKEKIIT